MKFGRTISDSPYVVNSMRGLATDEAGNLYVLNQNFGYGPYYVQAFDPEGRYLKTVMPFPAGLPKEAVSEFAYWDDQVRRPVPMNFMDVYPSFLPISSLTKCPPLTLLPEVRAGELFISRAERVVYRIETNGGTGGQPLRVESDKIDAFLARLKACAPLAKVPAHRTAVHPGTGHVYALEVQKTGKTSAKFQLVKYASAQAQDKLAELDLGTRQTTDGYLALSVRKGTNSIWVAGIEQPVYRVGRTDITRYDEQDGKFVPAVRLHQKDPAALGNHDVIAVDPRNDDVYINDDYSEFYRYNGLTGEGGNLKSVRKNFFATDLAVGPDGLLYVRSGSSYSGPFERLDRDLKPVPYPGGSHQLSDYIYSRFGAGYGEKGIGVGRDGRSYVIGMYGWTKYCVVGFDGQGKFLPGPYLKDKMAEAYAKEGKHLTSAIIGPIPKVNGGLRVDAKGNIYVGILSLPEGFKPPALLAADRGWKALVGSVIKFRPEGGEWVSTKGKTSDGTMADVKTEIPKGAEGLMMQGGHFFVGATAAYPGLAPFSGVGGSGIGDVAIGKLWCDCRSPRFDMDLYDRLYVPNCVNNTVRLYDNAGNVVLEFGGYANYDSQYVPPESKDRKPAVPTDYIPLGWPIGVGVSEEHLYVVDQLNRSVVRVDKTYGAEETVPVK